MKDFKLLFFNKIKGRFTLKEFRDIPISKTEFTRVLVEFGGFNTKKDNFIDSFYKKYLEIFKNIKNTNPDDYSKYYWRTECLKLNYPSSSDMFYQVRGWDEDEIKKIRSKKYATGTKQFQMKKHGISENEAIEKISETQKKIKDKRQKTYEKYLEENPNYWKENVGYGIKTLMNKKNITEEDAIRLHEEISKKISKTNKEWAKDKKENNPEYWNSRTETQLQYWLNKGYSYDESLEILKKRQTTFTLDKCIKKYGKRRGTKVFNDRQEKWLKSFPRTNYSKVSQELFIELYKAIKNDFNEIYFATLNNGSILDFNNGKNYEYTLKLKTSSIKPDFFVKDIGKIIEFDGVYWHRKNPENKKREENRDREIKAMGYQVYHVNEYEYHQNPKETIQKCINFIRE